MVVIDLCSAGWDSSQVEGKSGISEITEDRVKNYEIELLIF